jgi:hypothetical protein
MLLELCFGCALEEHQVYQKYAIVDAAAAAAAEEIEPNHFLNLAAALEWCPKANEEAGPEFQDAILWCLHDMPRFGGESSKRSWREGLFEKVVEPLRYCHGQLGGGAGASGSGSGSGKMAPMASR